MATFNVNCPHCGGTLEVQDEWAGMETTCPLCSTPLIIPRRENPVPPPPPPQQPAGGYSQAEQADPGAAVFSIDCPHCGGALEVQDEWRGMEVSCPLCAKPFVIPAQEIPQPPPVRRATPPPPPPGRRAAPPPPPPQQRPPAGDCSQNYGSPAESYREPSYTGSKQVPRLYDLTAARRLAFFLLTPFFGCGCLLRNCRSLGLGSGGAVKLAACTIIGAVAGVILFGARRGVVLGWLVFDILMAREEKKLNKYIEENGIVTEKRPLFDGMAWTYLGIEITLVVLVIAGIWSLAQDLQ